MSFYDDRARARAAALMLRGMLRELRSAPKDSRDFLVFDKRDDWRDLGVDDDHVAAFDLSDDALLDHHIAQADEAVRALGHVDGDEVTVTAAADGAGPFGTGYTTLYPRNYDPARSSGVTAIVTPSMIGAVNANRRRLAPNGGSDEPAIFGVPDGVGGYTIISAKGRAHSTPSGVSKTVPKPPNAAWIAHGHLEDANSFVDVPSMAKGFGDAHSLSSSKPIPNFTLFNGQAGWHDLDNGRLRFTYPSGSMTPAQIEQLQRNLDEEQVRLYRKN